MPEHDTYTRDLPKPFQQLSDRTVFRLPIFDGEGTFVNQAPFEISYPPEAIAASLRFALDAYVTIGKISPSDMQKMVNAGGIGNESFTGLGERVYPQQPTVFDDYKTIEYDRGSLSSFTHHLLFPGQSLLQVLDRCTDLEPNRAKEFARSFAHQYLTVRNSTMHFVFDLYEQWLATGNKISLKKLEKKVAKPDYPIIIPLTPDAYGPSLDIPLETELDPYDTTSPKVTALIQEIGAQSQVAERIMMMYWEMNRCYKALTGEDRPDPASDIRAFSNQYFRDLSFGLRNMENFLGRQNPHMPHPFILSAYDDPHKVGGHTYQQHMQLESFQRAQPLARIPEFKPKRERLELVSGDVVDIFQLGTCPLPIRALRRLEQYRSNGI